jgi:hypothetical protein
MLTVVDVFVSELSAQPSQYQKMFHQFVGPVMESLYGDIEAF